MKRDLLASVAVTGMVVAAIALVGADRLPVSSRALLLSPAGPIDREEVNLTIDGGTVDDRARMRLAIRRFDDAGLGLPPLQIVFRDPSDDECHGALGYFSPSRDVWKISICSEIDSVYEHELAHAWERANLSDAQRLRYTTVRELPTWSDQDYDWNQRGMEDVAFVIQQGLAGLPLPPALGDEATSRLEGYEMLTGRIAPRLVEWLAKHEASCGRRPTYLSLQLPDLSGRICGVVLSRRADLRSPSTDGLLRQQHRTWFVRGVGPWLRAGRRYSAEAGRKHLESGYSSTNTKLPPQDP